MIKVGLVQSEFTPVEIKTSVTFLKRRGTNLVEEAGSPIPSGRGSSRSLTKNWLKNSTGRPERAQRVRIMGSWVIRSSTPFAIR
jgi:hypothetical protein